MPELPEDTARVARNPVREGSIFRIVGDHLSALLADIRLQELYPAEVPPLPPGLLAMATVLQHIEGLADSQATIALRRRIEWKYALHLPLGFPGLDHLELVDFRERVIASRSGCHTIDVMLPRLTREGVIHGGLNAFQLFTSVRAMNRLLLVSRAMSLALEALSSSHPLWYRKVAAESWAERYRGPHRTVRIPNDLAAREALALDIAIDGFELIAALETAPEVVVRTPEVELLRHVWAWQFDHVGGEIRWRRPRPSEPPMVHLRDEVAATERWLEMCRHSAIAW